MRNDDEPSKVRAISDVTLALTSYGLLLVDCPAKCRTLEPLGKERKRGHGSKECKAPGGGADPDRQKVWENYRKRKDEAIAAGDHQHEIRTQNRVFADAEEGINQLKQQMAEESGLENPDEDEEDENYYTDDDGVDDAADQFPTDPAEWSDLDGDGQGDNSDPDRDNDGYSNEEEVAAGSDPNDPNSIPDTTPPEITVLGSQPFETDEDYFTLNGIATDLSGVASLTITNDQSRSISIRYF